MTTHDPSLLDVDLLRRDQYWFVEKEPKQVSRPYPLTDFSPRKSEAVGKSYLSARDGGVPSIANVAPRSTSTKLPKRLDASRSVPKFCSQSQRVGRHQR
jgi:hypothetical protein